MARTPSTMAPLGSAAADFDLVDAVSGRRFSLSDFDGKQALLVMFICNHCPFVKHVRAGLSALCREYQARGVAIVGISSNDIRAYPQDGPAHMAEEAREAAYCFPYLLDETQAVAKAYQAACTPDFYLYDRARCLRYRGQMDDSRPGNGVPVTGRDLRAALDAILAGQAVSGEQRPSIGCNIKWRPGNEPPSSSS